MDAASLRYDNEFDAAFSMFGVLYPGKADVVKALTQMARVVWSGGVLIFAHWAGAEGAGHIFVPGPGRQSVARFRVGEMVFPVAPEYLHQSEVEQVLTEAQFAHVRVVRPRSAVLPEPSHNMPRRWR
ncbi:class I SAM-dependent methyltransferase [Amycolatopsis sp. GM8]|uniref:class I SAM-dependent methyltransferase n=1 Tax=Amycolatopsis sp. GM8 TaxID=2896530 RepID=UPI001F19F7BD|nr:class I SAM-dependent methyltransferase [Amycolatopsis sp. GM8]